MRKLFLLRHGHTPITGTYVGSTDVELSPLGVEQIGKLAINADFQSVTQIIASPMLRCVQTVETLKLLQPVEYGANLREIDFGLWEGLTFDEVFAQYPEECNEWFAKPNSFRFPHGESVGEFRSRVAKIPEIIERYVDHDVLIVAHGGVIRTLICFLLGIPSEKFNQFRLDVAHYAMIELYEDSAVLAMVNRG